MTPGTVLRFSGTEVLDQAPSWPRSRDAAERLLLELRKHTFRSSARIPLARGGELRLQGSLLRKDFVVRDGDGVVLDARSGTGSRLLRWDLVVEGTGRLALTEVVVIVVASLRGLPP